MGGSGAREITYLVSQNAYKEYAYKVSAGQWSSLRLRFALLRNTARSVSGGEYRPLYHIRQGASGNRLFDPLTNVVKQGS